MTYKKFSFTCRIVNIWNSLPYYVTGAKTVDTFKLRLDKFWKVNTIKRVTKMDVFLIAA